MSDGATEPADVHCKIRRTAHKEHWCYACGGTIPRGGRYTLTTVINDGSIWTHKRCPRCDHIHARLVRKFEASVYPDEIDWPREDLNCGHEWTEHLGIPLPPELAALAFLTDDEIQARAAELLAPVPKEPPRAPID